MSKTLSSRQREKVRAAVDNSWTGEEEEEEEDGREGRIAIMSFQPLLCRGCGCQALGMSNYVSGCGRHWQAKQGGREVLTKL